MDVIVIESEAFYRLIQEVVDRVAKPREKERWIFEEEAMAMLGIKSKTTLWELRTEGKVRYSQPRKKILLYDRLSIEEYIEAHAQNTF